MRKNKCMAAIQLQIRTDAGNGSRYFNILRKK